MNGSVSILWTLLALSTCQLGGVLSDGFGGGGDEYPLVTLSQGTLKGQKVTPDGHSAHYRFLGIPYAKPPLGDFRFKAPVPPEPWNGTLEALQEGNVCLQPGDRFKISTQGDEDCLFLNVYTPELPGSGSLRPVMMWIHGGGFIGGSGNSFNQGPEFLLDTGIVYVSLNYRLGIFGFLGTQDAVVPGNAGLKDQVLALRWVQQNIAAFGGDPDQVTIFGESAGGVNVHYHMLSPMTEGLFRSAIAQSGASSCAWAIAEQPRKNAFLVGQALGYSGYSSQELVDFLRNVSAEDLMSTSLTTVNPEDEYRLMNMFHELPVMEPNVEGEEAFITENPLILLEEGRFHKVPFLTGTTSAEGLFLVAGGIFQRNRTLEEVDEDFVQTFRPELRLCRYSSCGDEMLTKVRSFYFANKSLDNDTLESLVEMTTDMSFAEGVLYGVNKISSVGSQPVYFYQFSYDGGLGSKASLGGLLANLSGVPHGDELGYIFNHDVQVAPDSLDAKVRLRMVSLWTNFAKTGNPTPEVTEEFPAWLPYTKEATNYLDINSELMASTDFRKKRMDFWDDLYSSAEN